MVLDGKGCMCLDYIILVCGLIGFWNIFLIMIFGIGILIFIFSYYGLIKEGDVISCQNGVLVFMVIGIVLIYLFEILQSCGKLFLDFGDEIYEGQLCGIYSCDNDLVMNLIKGKKLDNMCVFGKDEVIGLVLLIKFILEQVFEFIDDDELVEVIFKFICLCKKLLMENECKCVKKK